MRSATPTCGRDHRVHLGIEISSTRLQRSSTDLLIQYFEVYFDDVARELANAGVDPGLRQREEAAARLREFIRGLIRVRNSGVTDANSAISSVETLAGASAAEKEVLRTRMLAVLERAESGPMLAFAPRSEPGVNGHGGAGTAVETAASNGTSAAEPNGKSAVDPAEIRPPVRIQQRPTLAPAIAPALTSVLQALATKCIEVLAADLCQVFLLEEDTLSLRAEAPLGTPLIPGPRSLSPRTGFVAALLAAGAAIGAEVRDNMEGSEQVWRDRGMTTVAGISLGDLGGRASGVLVVARGGERAFLDAELAVLTALATEVAQAMAGSDLLARAEELAVLKERMKLAREIHDGLASDLSAVVALFKYHAHRRLLDPEDADRMLVQMRELVEGSLQSARDILATLRPRAQVSGHIGDAVRRQTDEFARTYGISATVNIMGEENEDISADERDTTFQILREALTNVRKHSEAARLQVTLDLRARPFTLVVEDDGVGIDLSEVDTKAGSFGLLGIRERAELVGGWVDVSNGHLGGARIMFHGPERPLASL